MLKIANLKFWVYLAKERHLGDGFFDEWVSEQCFTSPPTQYRLYGRRFLQVKRPNQQYQSTEGDWFLWWCLIWNEWWTNEWWYCCRSLWYAWIPGSRTAASKYVWQGARLRSSCGHVSESPLWLLVSSIHTYSKFRTAFTDLNMYWIKGALALFVLVSGYVC